MPLTVLPSPGTPTPQALLRLFHQTELEWHRHATGEFVLDHGIALVSQDRDIPSCFLAVVPPAMADWTGLLVQATEFFRDKNATLDELHLSGSVPSAEAQLFAEFLVRSGWTSQTCEVLRLATRKPQAPALADAIRLIPARASFRHVAELDAILPAKLMPHLDDPHVDAWLAMDKGQAAGLVAVQAVGETGRIGYLAVAEKFRQRGIGKRLLERALDIAARALLKNLFIAVSAEQTIARQLLTRGGFESVGPFTIFRPIPSGTAMSSH